MVLTVLTVLYVFYWCDIFFTWFYVGFDSFNFVALYGFSTDWPGVPFDAVLVPLVYVLDLPLNPAGTVLNMLNPNRKRLQKAQAEV